MIQCDREEEEACGGRQERYICHFPSCNSFHFCTKSPRTHTREGEWGGPSRLYYDQVLGGRYVTSTPSYFPKCSYLVPYYRAGAAKCSFPNTQKEKSWVLVNTWNCH
jgi:hypothetical protein